MMDEAWATARLTAFAALGDVEIAELINLAGKPQKLKRGAVIREEGDAPPSMYLLLSGWTASSIAIAGGGRQLIKIHLPGDLLGLPSLALTRACDTLFTLSAVVISKVESAAIGRLFERSPRLAALLFLISQEERARLMDRIASIGRTNAVGRLAGLILQLHARVLRNNPGAGDTFEVPLLQDHLADLTGLSKVHVNRSLKQLRLDGVIRWSGRSLAILDLPALNRLAEIAPRELARDLSWLPANRSG
jgi:CRP/FNR family transcriptional regulator